MVGQLSLHSINCNYNCNYNYNYNYRSRPYLCQRLEGPGGGGPEGGGLLGRCEPPLLPPLPDSMLRCGGGPPPIVCW